jgi:hypothetical protein
MADQPIEEIPGQQTLDEAAETEHVPDGGTPDGGPGDDLDPTVGFATTSTVESSGTASAEPDPTSATAESGTSGDAPSANETATATTKSPADAPEVHRFRIVHETSNEGDNQPHTIKVSAPLELESAFGFLAAHAHDLPKVIAFLTSLL